MSVFPDSVDIEAFLPQLVEFENLVNANSTEDGKIRKTSAGAAWDAGGTSVQTRTEKNWYVEAKITQALAGAAIGLSNGNTDEDFDDIDFGIQAEEASNDLNVIEGGVTMFTTTYEADDRVRVAVVSGEVRYFLNDNLIYTSLTAPTYPLLVDVSIRIQNSGWDDVKVGVWQELLDVQISSRIGIRRGIQGTTFRDRVASTGSMDFQLDNSANNSQGLLGLYSPNNSNVLDGWRIGVQVRCSVVFQEQRQFLFYGTIESIIPTSGKFGARKVLVSCVDWIDEAARVKVKGLTVLQDVRSDEVFNALLANMENQPPEGSVVQIGGDEYPFALDNAFSEEVNVMTEFQRLIQSEQGYIYVRRDGVLIFESRHKRPNIFTVNISLTDADIAGVATGRGRDSIINRAEVQAHPRRVDAAATSVLFQLASTPEILRSTDLIVEALYRDPDARATRVGGIEMVQPVATTDYEFFENADGTGSDYTAQLSVVAVFSGNSAVVTVTNNGPFDGFLTKLNLRGKGIYAYETALATADSEPSKARYGETTFALDMPYQDDLNVSRDAAEFIVNQAKDILTQVDGVTFWANREERLMNAALQRDISDKINLVETVIGSAPFFPIGEMEQQITATDFFINSVDLTIGERGIIRCRWGLAPGDPFSYWILERDGFTELGITTRLGYGAFVAGWVLDSSALGTDTRVNQ
jgi:hypothetical protein